MSAIRRRRPRLPSRREFLRQTGRAGLALSAAGLAGGTAGGLLAGCAGPRRSPNIVLIFIDDMGWGDIGVYGARGYETPYLDRMAAEGMRFTDFYASQAVCSASRASLLTGCYSERVSILGALGPDAQIGLHPGETTIAEVLKPLGYATAAFGKWHLGHLEPFLPLQHGFDEYLGLPYSNDMWPVDYDGTPATSGNKVQYPPLPLIEGNEPVATIADLSGQDTLTTRYTERALDFIRRNRDRPFFLYLAHSMVHVPLGVSEKFRGHSARGLFGDVVEEVDWSVGQVLTTLDRLGLAEGTLVVFTCDNGPWLNFGNHAGLTGGLREGKGTAFEGGPRVPAVMRWPGHIPPGSVCECMAATIDVLPTVAAATGAALPEREIDGVSILPLLVGDGTAEPRTQFWFYYGGELRAVREGRWKRVYRHRTRSYVGVEPGQDGYPGPYAFPTVPEALYDLEADPAETTDVSAAHPDIVRRLDGIAEQARTALGDRLTGRRGAGIRPPGRIYSQQGETVAHLAVGAAVTLTEPPNPRYAGEGARSLTDGRLGSRDHQESAWLGFEGADLEAVVDLGEEKTVRRIGLDCLQAQGAWIFLPRRVSFTLSRDGVSWDPVRERTLELERQPAAAIQRVTMEYAPTRARYVRLQARNQGTCPPWHPGAGGQAWLFVDEIVVE